MTEQEREIATIKERTIKLNLSDADCERIATRAGSHGLTVAELLENFIGDLVGGTYMNGSDEGMYADQWFDRCWFGMFPENTLLKHLLDWGYEPEDYLDKLDNMETAEQEKKNLEDHPEEADEEEASFLDDAIASWEEDLKDMRENWKTEKEPNMEEEIDRLKKWVDEVTKLKGSDHDDEEKEECIPVAASLRWLAGMFPFIPNPKDEADKMSNAINTYATAGADKIFELDHVIRNMQNTN